MKARLNASEVDPEPSRILSSLEKHLSESGLDPILRELVKIRASQINGCAYCLDMHTKDARALGETEQRIYALNAWQETPFFTDKERAALALTEAVTLIPTGVSAAVYDEVKQHFSEKEIVELTWSIAAINAWNRIAITFHAVPGHYQPGDHK